MRTNLHIPGLHLLSLPRLDSGHVNRKRRGVTELGHVTAAELIGVGSFCPDKPTLLWGPLGKSFPILRQLILRSRRPWVLVGTRKELESSCLLQLNPQWNDSAVPSCLNDGSGVLFLAPGGKTLMEMKYAIPQWNSHLIVLSLGNGLQLDRSLFDLLNQHGQYFLLSEALQRGICAGNELSVKALLSCMDAIFASAIGTGAQELIPVLPTYESERFSNITDISLFGNQRDRLTGGHHGGGLRLSQSRSVETKSVLTMDELTRMQDQNFTLAMNNRSSHLWVAQIAR